jgi:hypothetical protein
MSRPPVATVTTLGAVCFTCLIAITDPSVGAVGSVTVNAPVVAVSQGTKSPTAAV